VLCVTSQGEKCLSQHDPINHVLNAVAALGTEECIKLRDSLTRILNHLDATHQRFNASICRDCMFLAERGPRIAKGRTTAEFMCRLYRAPISLEETELLCTSFEHARDRPKIDEQLDRAHVASRG
jgi:MarR family transcriptional regulator, negative regulator of the multidrug operon emrRAB